MRVRSYLVAGVSAATLVIGLTGCPGLVPGVDPSSNNSPAPTSDAANSSIHEGTISSNQTWTKAKSPHIVRGDVRVESTGGATLTIEPGAEVRFEQDSSLSFGWSTGTTGVLKAVGTSTESITFTSANASKAKGDWEQIYIGNGGASSVLSYAKVMYGGGDGSNITGALRVDGAANKPTVTHCAFENNNGSAVYVDPGASFTAFEDNAIKTSGKSPLKLDANAVGSLGAGNTFEANDLQAIEVSGGTMSKSGRWRNFGVPYLILDTVKVEGTGNAAVLTLDAGNTLRFVSGAGMWFAWSNNTAAALYAVGTPTETITFTGIESNPNAGAWDQLYFGTGTVKGVADTATTTYLKNVVIQYGGGAGEYGAVRVDASQPLFESVSIHDNAGYGLYVDDTGNTTPPLSIQTGITFNANALGNVYHPSLL